ASRLAARLDLEQRRKGLLWHPTYRVQFTGRYRVVNEGTEPGRFEFALPLPAEAAVFSNVALTVDGRPAPAVADGGRLAHTLALRPGQSKDVTVRYASQGVGTWRYALGDADGAGGVRSARDVSLVVSTDADDIDVPEGTLSPTSLRAAPGGGRVLAWEYGTLLAAADLGVAMPQRLNPGPWVSRVTFFAPVSLFLFFFAVFVLSVLRGVRLHPMHYFFLGAACFAFHLLLAYLVDVVTVPTAMALASLASLGLVVSYVRLVAGPRFALVEVGGAQAVYLVGFAATFFLDGTTGLAVTLLSVATLFVVMQGTGRMDWESVLASARVREREGVETA
ncbi:MAG TPA: inner membrane CreD family protein, partial [Rubricoccaceae bacterium]